MTDSKFESGRRSGIHDLIEHRAQPRAPAFVQVDEATWRRYAYNDWLELWELVLLHSRIDPAFLGCEGFRNWVKHCRRRRNPIFPRGLHMDPPKLAFHDERLLLNYEQALKAFQSAELKKSALYSKFVPCLPDEDGLVHVNDFHAWDTEVELPIVDGPWRERHELDAELPGVVYRFPHRTPLLDLLEQLAWKVFKVSKGKGLTGARVVAMAREICAGVSNNVADACATFLRRGDAPRGRPPRSHD